jgi:TonB-linked SusC/RagA family outer membrane protein
MTLSNRSQHPIRSAIRLIATLTLACAVGTVALLTPRPAAAQATGRITGVVTSDQGTPIPGAQVVVDGTAVGAVSGDNGRYTIPNVTPGTRTVRAQRIGYAPQTQTVTVGDGQTTTADFQLATVATRLSSQIVVGYTTQTNRDVSDAVSTVSAAEIGQATSATVEEALRGRVPGVQINASGEPGRPAQVFIRGQGFITTSTPLYVVDGMYLRQNPNLNPDDIESIVVLKDASAAAQYGSQSANGVIVITTKRGRASDNNRVELRSYYGTQDIPKQIDMMSSREWATIQQQAYVNAGLPVPAGVTNALSASPVNLVNTNWQNAVFQNGKIQNHQLSVGGGKPNASYMISGGVFDQDGAIVETGFRRYSLRVNSDVSRGRFNFGENVALSRAKRQGLTGFPLIDVVRMLPTIAVYDANNPSGYGYGSGANPTFGTNPVGLLQRQPRTERSNQVIGSAFGEVNLPAHFKYRLNLGINYENYGRSEFTSIAQIRQGSPNQFAQLTEIRNDFTSLLAENLLSFDNQFRNNTHRINAVAGYTEQTDNADDISAYRRGFNDENLTTINAGGEAALSNSGARRRTVLHSWLARANYVLLDRYLVTGSVRRDGSSRFGPNNKWGTFSAISAGWIVSEERFFPSTPILSSANYLKLRASTGTLGNQDIGDYGYSVPLEQNRLGYPIGSEVLPGATQTRLANPDIHWQDNRMSNFGFDLGVLQDRLTLSAEYYVSRSGGILLRAPLPWSLGLGENPDNAPYVNAGTMRNTGFELGLTHRAGSSSGTGFRLNSSATLTTARNKVLSLGNGGQPLFDETGAARTAVGSSVGTFYLVRTAGIFQSAAEVTAHTTTVNGTVRVIQPTAQPGDVRFVDANGDGQINDDDRVEMGNGTPKYSGGLFFDGGYSAFDFQLNMRGAGGFKIFNVARYWTDRTDDPSNYRKGFAPWTPTNNSRTTPRAIAAGNANTRFLSDRWLEDGNYWRIQNVAIGYALPASFTSRLGASADMRSRVFVNIQNLHTFTKFSNWDPETLGYGNPLGRGVDDGRIYPNVRTFSFGLELKL